MEAGRDKVFNKEDSAAVQTIAQLVQSRRPELDGLIDRTTLAQETLPILTDIQVSVDLRLSFSDTSIKDGIAVAIVHLRTDSDQELWLQLSRGSIDLIQKKLKEATSRMEIAEQLLHKPREARDL